MLLFGGRAHPMRLSPDVSTLLSGCLRRCRQLHDAIPPGHRLSVIYEIHWLVFRVYERYSVAHRLAFAT